MSNLIKSLLLVAFLGILTDRIAADCGTNMTCLRFSDCSNVVSSSQNDSNLAMIYTTGENIVEFKLRYDSAGWIAIGLSDSRSMIDSYIFMCVRVNASQVDIQERYASVRSRPPTTTSYLSHVSNINNDSILQCTFTSPVTRTPNLNKAGGYYLLLAWGQYSSGDIQKHADAGRCVTMDKVVVTTAVGSGTGYLVAYSSFIILNLSILVLLIGTTYA